MPHCLNYKNDAVIEAVSNLAKEMKQRESQTLFQVEIWQEQNEIYDRFPTKEELEKFNFMKDLHGEENPINLLLDQDEEVDLLGPDGHLSEDEQEAKRLKDAKRTDLMNKKVLRWQDLAALRHKYKHAETQRRLKEAKKIVEEQNYLDEKGFPQYEIKQIADAKRDIKIIESNERVYKKEFEEYQQKYDKAVEYSINEKNEEKSIKELTEDYWKLVDKYHKDESLPAREKIMEILRGKYEEETQKKIKEKNPDYDPKKQSTEDLPAISKFLYNLSSVGASHADIQALTRLKDTIVAQRNEEAVKADTEIREAIEALYKENAKTITGKVKNFVSPFVDRSSMYKFMNYTANYTNKETGETSQYNARITSKYFDKDKVAKKKFESLTKAQKDFVKVYDKYVDKFKGIQDRKNANGQTVGLSPNSFIKVSKSLSDTIAGNSEKGLLKNYIKYLSTFGGAKDNIYLYFKTKENGKEVTKELTFRQIKNEIEKGVKDNLWSKFHAVYLLNKYKKKAEAQLLKKQHEVEGYEWDDSLKESEYGLTQRGRMVSKFHNAGTKYMKEYSGDHGRALREYVQDMTYIKHMEQLVPLVDSIDYFNSENPNRKNTKAFMDIWTKGYLYKEKTISTTPKFDRWIKFLRAWTHLRVMAFNIPAGAFNVLLGKYQTFRGMSTKTQLLGEKRYWKNFKKSQAVLDKYKLLSIETGKDYIPRIGHYFDKLMFGLTEIGENYIQGSSIIGQLKPKYWNWLDNKGNIKSVDENEKQLNAEQIEERDKIIREQLEEARTATFKLQGAYSKDDIRNFGHFELGRAISQFRVWMPEVYDDRFGKKKIDAYGNQHQGTLNYMFTKGWKEIGKDIKDPKFFTSDEYEYQLKRRNLKSAIAVATILAGALAFDAAGGDDDDEETILANQFYKILGEMLFIFNPQSLKFTMDNMVASEGTVSSFLDVILNIGDFYKTGKHKGDSKAIGNAEKVIPYKNVYKSLKSLADDSE